MTGYVGRARSPTRWVISFALTLVMYVLLRVIFAVVVVAMSAVLMAGLTSAPVPE